MERDGSGERVRPSLLRPLLAESIGTFVLVLVGCGAIVAHELHGAPDATGIALSFGLVVAVMVATFGGVSGAHLNPAVTVAAAVTRAVLVEARPRVRGGAVRRRGPGRGHVARGGGYDHRSGRDRALCVLAAGAADRGGHHVRADGGDRRRVERSTIEHGGRWCGDRGHGGAGVALGRPIHGCVDESGAFPRPGARFGASRGALVVRRGPGRGSGGGCRGRPGPARSDAGCRTNHGA